MLLLYPGELYRLLGASSLFIPVSCFEDYFSLSLSVVLRTIFSLSVSDVLRTNFIYPCQLF
jgi:hypothetical protein